MLDYLKKNKIACYLLQYIDIISQYKHVINDLHFLIVHFERILKKVHNYGRPDSETLNYRYYRDIAHCFVSTFYSILKIHVGMSAGG